jgi:DNA ligase 1
MQDIDFSYSRFDGIKVAADWIRDLESSDSRLHKEAVVEKALMAANLGSAGAQCFLFNCYQAYNPYYVFGVRQVPETEGLVDRPNPWTEFWALLESLRTRSVTGHRARDRIQAVAEQFDSEEWNGLARRVLIKDLRCGISEKTLNKVLKNTQWAIPVFSCQLAQDSTDQPKKLRGIKRLEVKLDGVRVLAVVSGDTANLYSRNGKPFENFPQIAEYIEEHRRVFQHGSGTGGRFVLDGEIVGESFQKLMKQAHRKTDAVTDGMTYHVFDIIPLHDFERGHWNAPQTRRIDMLARAQEQLPKDGSVQVMPGVLVDLDTAEGHDVMRRFAEASVEQGYEGIMIKSMDAPYECKRSSFWMKYKPVHDYDLKVVAVEEGTGKNSGKMGALVCEGMDQGKFIRVNVGSGFTDAERREYWDRQTEVIGQTVVILCDAITQNQDGNYSLRFPRFKTFRDDK